MNQKVTWAPEGGTSRIANIDHRVNTMDLEQTRVAYLVPGLTDDTAIRVFEGRCFRRHDLVEAFSSKETLADVEAEMHLPMRHAFIANDLLWVPCSEPGYSIVQSEFGVSINTVIPAPGQYPDLFSLRELKTVQAEALEMALSAGHSDSVAGILETTPVFVADGARVNRPTREEKQAARATRLETALQMAETLRGSSAEEMAELLTLHW